MDVENNPLIDMFLSAIKNRTVFMNWNHKKWFDAVL